MLIKLANGYTARRHDITDRYVITDARGAVVADAANPLHAHDVVARLWRTRNRAERPCMCCRAMFESEGIHNRLCPTCR